MKRTRTGPTLGGLGILLCLAPAVVQAEPVYSQGERLDASLDSMRVEAHWQPGDAVDWQTGRHDPGAVPLGSHCSAFVAAVCAKFGIYILRPPDHPEELLANAQCDWLRIRGPREGWRRVTDGMTAQSLANRGYIVVACYRNPDGDDAGHIAIVRPGTKGRTRIQAEGPDVIQAGTLNYRKTTAKNGFRFHSGAWKRGRIRYYSHATSLVGLS